MTRPIAEVRERLAELLQQAHSEWRSLTFSPRGPDGVTPWQHQADALLAADALLCDAVEVAPIRLEATTPDEEEKSDDG